MKAQPVGFVERLDLECEEKKEVKEGTLEFNLSIWKEGVGCKWDEGRWGREELSFGHTEIEMLIIRSRGEEKWRADIIWGGVSTWIMVKPQDSMRATGLLLGGSAGTQDAGENVH